MAKRGPTADVIEDETNPRAESVEAERAKLDERLRRYHEHRKVSERVVAGQVLNQEPGYWYAAQWVPPEHNGTLSAQIHNTRELWHKRGYEFVHGPEVVSDKYDHAPGVREERYPDDDFMEIWRVHDSIRRAQREDLDKDFAAELAQFGLAIGGDGKITKARGVRLQ